MTQSVPDTTQVSAYATVLQVAWDSVFTPFFRAAGPLPIVVWDSTVAGPLLPDRAVLPQDALEQFTASNLATGTCPTRNLEDCGFSRPLVYVVLLTIQRKPDGTLVSGFMEFLTDGTSGPKLHGTSWSVTLAPDAKGWRLVNAKMILQS